MGEDLTPSAIIAYCVLSFHAGVRFFGTKKQLQSAHSIEGIDSSSLGVHHFPPGTIVFHPNEIQEIETEIIAMQTLQDNKVIVLEEFIQDSEKREPQQYLKSKVIETFQEIGKIFIIALLVFSTISTLDIFKLLTPIKLVTSPKRPG